MNDRERGKGAGVLNGTSIEILVDMNERDKWHDRVTKKRSH